MDLNESEDLLKSNLAMRVAVQTMKERCQSLQQRVTGLEEENFELRNRLRDQKNSDYPSSLSDNIEENEVLRKQILDLHQQKAQLSEHVAMVAAENRQLWSRLSQLSKRNNSQNTSEDFENKTISSPSSNNQALIRSKTFTQHYPNPYLRPKRIETDDQFNKSDSLSLDEVVLTNQTKTNYRDDNNGDLIESLKGDALQFSYYEEDSNDIDARELTSAALKCVEELNYLKQHLLLQQKELTKTILDVKNKLANRSCKECEQRSVKPETADKSLETDESLYTDISPSQSHQEMQNSSGSVINEIGADALNQQDDFSIESVRICPMCGRIFSKDLSFDEFTRHVTEHFIDEDEGDSLYDRHFEVISNKVGEF